MEENKQQSKDAKQKTKNLRKPDYDFTIKKDTKEFTKKDTKKDTKEFTTIEYKNGKIIKGDVIFPDFQVN